MKRKLLAGAAAAAVAAMIAGGAYAARQQEPEEALAIANAKISLVQAVTAAEQHAGGKAAKAELETSQGRQVFDVEVVTAKTVMDVKVDATDGKVLSAVEDAADHDDGDNNDNEDNDTED
jgi:uncharacterized membrane protein YkoI